MYRTRCANGTSRDVPFNAQTGKHFKNLDQHLMEQAIEALMRIREQVEDYEVKCRGTNWLSFSYSLVGGITIHFNEAMRSPPEPADQETNADD